MKILDDVASVSIGGWCALAIKKDGTLWTWGQMGYGEDAFQSNVPVKVMDGVVSACTGPQCAAAIKTAGSLWMWGSDTCDTSYLDSDDENIWSFSKIPAIVMDNVAEVSIGSTSDSGGYAYVAAIQKDGSLWL